MWGKGRGYSGATQALVGWQWVKEMNSTLVSEGKGLHLLCGC